jgi:predicted  nucleic acid-binding Zn-ribbon protein
MLISLSEQVGLLTSMSNLYKIKGNFNLKKQVALTTTLTKELDSTTEEVEFWQGKYEKAMKTIRKMKHQYPQDLETLSDEETKEFSLHSLPRKMATRAPPSYVIPNDVEDQE